MPLVTSGLSSALCGLDAALDGPRRDAAALGSWRWAVCQRLALVRDALVGEASATDDGWLAARSGSASRERTALLARLGALAPRVLESADAEAVRVEAKRLRVDIARHVQRLHDLAYDDVEIELGGSE